jgi:two-component system, OmpR family, copper resistance phosphate regulon response regulator CusR
MHILIIEDEPKVATFIKKSLEEQNFTAEIAYDGLLGERMVNQFDYELVILDIILPYINGIELCKRIKQLRPSLPVIMLTALGTTDDKLTGFDAGADDYLVKPFEFRELLARIKAISKRTSGVALPGSRLIVSDLELDLDKKIAIRGNHTISLTAKEFMLLEYFMRNKGRVLSRADIAANIWEITFDTGTNVVDVYVNILRKKIEKGHASRLIHTRFGMGYIFGEEMS